MRDATLCFLVKGNQILLGMKKRGFGEGKLNGFGGKVGENETIEEAAVRELYEETGVKVDPNDLRKTAELSFYFPYVHKEKKWDQVVHVFFIEKWEGEPLESEEMSVVWTDIDKIPFERMWQDDRHWLPMVLQNKKLRATFRFDKDNNSIMDYRMDEVDTF